MQLKWLAPTGNIFELGAEVGRGANFPGTDRNKNGAGSGAVFGHVGGDIGTSHSWRAGLSYLRTRPQSREHEDTDLAGATVKNTFSGSSKLWIGDFVWKWAPEGNTANTYFKLQGEYFRRQEDGRLTYDTESTARLIAMRPASPVAICKGCINSCRVGAWVCVAINSIPATSITV